MKIPRKAPCPCCGAPRRAIDPADIRRARQAAGLTGRAFAALAGISPPYLSEVERGRKPIPPAVLAAAEALEATR